MEEGEEAKRGRQILNGQYGYIARESKEGTPKDRGGGGGGTPIQISKFDIIKLNFSKKVPDVI